MKNVGKKADKKDSSSLEGMTAKKIKETDTFMTVNLRAAKRICAFTLYADGKNIFSYIQDEKHTDNAIFMYAPIYGATWYAGVSVAL